MSGIRFLRAPRAAAWSAAVIGVVLLTAPLGVRSRALWVGDETRDAAIADGMARSGDYLHPRLAGRTVPEKPFFFYAMVASSYRMTHRVDPFTTRLPAVLFSAITLAATAAAGRRLFSPRAGFLAAVILSTTYLFVVNAHDCIVDVALAAAVSTGFAAFLRSSDRAGHARWEGTFGAAVAATLLVKGLVGPVLLILTTIPFRRRAGVRRSLRESVSAPAVAIPLAALLFWTGIVAGAGGPAALKDFLWTHQFGRFLGFAAEEYSHHRAPFFFSLFALPGLLFPWSLTLPAAAWESWKEGRRDRSAPLFAAMILALLTLSAAGTKRTIYFFPVVPIASLAVAGYLDRRIARRRENPSPGLRLQAAAIGSASAAVALVPALADGRISAAEASVAAGVTAVSVWLFLVSKHSERRLVASSLAIAIASLVLLDRFTLPQIDRDRPVREFFARVRSRVGASGRIYAYRLNEDVLGRACLDLAREPLADDDWTRVLAHVRREHAYVLAESWKVDAVRAGLVAVEQGELRGRRVALYSKQPELAWLGGTPDSLPAGPGRGSDPGARR